MSIAVSTSISPTLFPNLSRTRMAKYSARAKVTKAALMRIQRMRGQIRSEVGMLLVALLFRLINIRRRVSKRPSLCGEMRQVGIEYHHLV